MNHPSDEFDRIPESSARQGVHRERLIPAGSSGLGLKITVVVLSLLILVGAVLLIPRLGLVGGEAGPAVSASAQDPSGTSLTSAAADTAPSVSAAPSAGATDDDEPSGTSTEPGSDSSDRGQVVNVLNGTGSPGLATVAAGRLAADGWTSAVPGNWAGAPLDTSVVFYNGEMQRSSAEEVAEELGISDVIESPDVSADISVVLGPDFQ